MCIRFLYTELCVFTRIPRKVVKEHHIGEVHCTQLKLNILACIKGMQANFIKSDQILSDPITYDILYFIMKARPSFMVFKFHYPY